MTELDLLRKYIYLLPGLLLRCMGSATSKNSLRSDAICLTASLFLIFPQFGSWFTTSAPPLLSSAAKSSPLSLALRKLSEAGRLGFDGYGAAEQNGTPKHKSQDKVWFNACLLL